MRYHFTSRLTATSNLCLTYFKIKWALAILLEHMQKKAEINRTKIKDGCQSERKVVPHDSKSDLPLMFFIGTFLTRRLMYWNLDLTDDLSGNDQSSLSKLPEKTTKTKPQKRNYIWYGWLNRSPSLILLKKSLFFLFRPAQWSLCILAAISLDIWPRSM